MGIWQVIQSTSAILRSVFAAEVRNDNICDFSTKVVGFLQKRRGYFVIVDILQYVNNTVGWSMVKWAAQGFPPQNPLIHGDLTIARFKMDNPLGAVPCASPETR